MNLSLNELTHEVIGAAIEVHRKLGPGLLESAYRKCLGRELFRRGIRFEKEYPLPLEYKGIMRNYAAAIAIVPGRHVP